MYAADRSFSGQPENARRRIGRIHFEVIEDSGRGSAWISINLTDREEDWIYNHRCPDGAVILRSNPRRWVGERQAAFFGGPDLVLEILSEGEDVRTKLPFYRDLKVREVLIVDPETGSPELWGLQGEGYRKVQGPSAVIVLSRGQLLRRIQPWRALSPAKTVVPMSS